MLNISDVALWKTICDYIVCKGVSFLSERNIHQPVHRYKGSMIERLKTKPSSNENPLRAISVLSIVNENNTDHFWVFSFIGTQWSQIFHEEYCNNRTRGRTICCTMRWLSKIYSNLLSLWERNVGENVDCWLSNHFPSSSGNSFGLNCREVDKNWLLRAVRANFRKQPAVTTGNARIYMRFLFPGPFNLRT